MSDTVLVIHQPADAGPDWPDALSSVCRAAAAHLRPSGIHVVPLPGSSLQAPLGAVLSDHATAMSAADGAAWVLLSDARIMPDFSGVAVFLSRGPLSREAVVPFGRLIAGDGGFGTDMPEAPPGTLLALRQGLLHRIGGTPPLHEPQARQELLRRVQSEVAVASAGRLDARALAPLPRVGKKPVRRSEQPARALTPPRIARRPLAARSPRLPGVTVPSARSSAVVCTMRTGGKGPRTYTRDHALWLYRQCRRNVLNESWEFVCFTDDADLLANPPPGPFRAVPLEHDWPGWWAKLEMFRSDVWPARRPESVLALDLDTVIRHPFFVPVAERGTLRMIRAFTDDRSGWMSGVMLWHGDDDYSRIPADFGKHQAAYRWCCRGQGGGDQEFIAFHELLAGRTIAPVDDVLPVVPFQDSDRRPDVAIVPWWGTDKPWSKPTKFTPPFKADASKTAIVGVWFGALHDRQRLEATRRGVSEWAKLDPRPKIVLVDASGEGEAPFPAIPGAVVVKLPVYPENDWLWHKEALWNVGAREALKDKGISALIFADADCHWPDCPEIASLVQDACIEHDWIQPFSVVRETSPTGRVVQYKSYSLAKAEGARDIATGQGFVHALSRRFYEAFGGFDERGLEGGGDAVACMQTDENCRHSATALKNFHDINAVIEDYRGPKTPWTCLPVPMEHVWHGDRRGDADTRQYYARHLVWDVCGGRLAVAEKDPRNELWRWKNTREAKAAQDVRRRQKDLQTASDVRMAYDKLMAYGEID